MTASLRPDFSRLGHAVQVSTALYRFIDKSIILRFDEIAAQWEKRAQSAIINRSTYPNITPGYAVPMN
jgi:hypothetical protein